MNKEKLLGVREAFKKALDLTFENKNLGYFVKIILFTSILYSLLATVVVVPMFLMGLKSSYDQATAYQKATDKYRMERQRDMERLERLTDPKYKPSTQDYTELENLSKATMPAIPSRPEPELSPGLAIALGLVGAVLGFVVGMVQYNLMILGPINIYKGELVGFKEILKRSLSRSLSMFILLIMYFFIVLAGFILFIIPGIFFAVRLSFAPYIMLDENKGPLASIKASWALIKGYTLSLYIKMLCFMLLAFIIMVVFIPALAVGFYTGMGTIIMYVFQLLFMLFAITLYFDLKRIKGAAASAAPEPQMDTLTIAPEEPQTPQSDQTNQEELPETNFGVKPEPPSSNPYNPQ